MFTMSTVSNTVTRCNNKYIYTDCIDRQSFYSGVQISRLNNHVHVHT